MKVIKEKEELLAEKKRVYGEETGIARCEAETKNPIKKLKSGIQT